MRLWGQQLVIINQPGAGGTAAARTAASAAPDGYTLYLAATSTFLVMPLMFPNQPFDIDRDFVRVGFVGEQPMVFGAAPSLGVSTLPELVALSKKRPGEILYAANLRGTFPHLTVERLRKETGADLTFVPYPGAAAGLQDLMGGRISLVVESVGALYGAMQSGSIKPLAVASKERLPNLPGHSGRGRDRSGFRSARLVRAAGAGRHAGRDRAPGQQGSAHRSRPAGAAQKLPGSRHLGTAHVARGDDAVHPQGTGSLAADRSVSRFRAEVAHDLLVATGRSSRAPHSDQEPS